MNTREILRMWQKAIDEAAPIYHNVCTFDINCPEQVVFEGEATMSIGVTFQYDYGDDK
jgi:hypothetical protein